MIKISKLIVFIITLTLFMARIPPQSSMYCFKSLSKYSKTRVNDFSVWTMSCKVTIKRNIKMLLLLTILKMNFIIETTTRYMGKASRVLEDFSCAEHFFLSR